MPTRSPHRHLHLLACAGLVSAADNWIVAPLLPTVAAGFGVPVARAAVVLTAYLIPYGLLQPVHGALSERWGRVRLLHWLLLGLAAGTGACALAGSLAALALARFATGCCAAGMIAVSLAWIGDRAPAAERQAWVGRFMGIVFCGQGLSAGLGGLLAKTVGWRPMFLLFALAALGLYGPLRRLPAPPGPVAGAGWAAQARRALGRREGLRTYAQAGAAGFLLLGMYGFLGAYWQRAGGLGPLAAGAVAMGFGFACLAAGLSLGRVSRALGEAGTLRLGLALALGAALLLERSAGGGAGLVAVVCLGLGYVCVQSTLATRAFDLGANGVASALVGLGLFGGGGLGTAAGAWVLGRWGFGTLWVAFGSGLAAWLALALLSAFPTPSAHRRRCDETRRGS